MSFDVSCSHLLLPICLVTCQGDEVYRPLLGTAKGFQQGDAQGVSNLGFCFNFLLVVRVQDPNQHFEALDPGRQHAQRTAKFLHWEVGLFADTGKVFQECGPPPYGGGPHS
jgi:hypothetical protein